MNRLTSTLASLKKENKKALSIFLTAGFPSQVETIPLVKAIERGGANILELGIPFSDPLADGPTIQYSSQLALEQGMTLQKIFTFVKDIRRFSSMPIVLMGYINSLLAYGTENFFRECSLSGVDGIIIPDLPMEEAEIFSLSAKENNISIIFLATPTTTDERLKLLDNHSNGFLYCVSITGVTGARKVVSIQASAFLKRAKKIVTKNPLLVGFGISTEKDAQEMAKYSDGIIVGSALIDIIRNSKTTLMIKNVEEFVKKLRTGLDKH